MSADYLQDLKKYVDKTVDEPENTAPPTPSQSEPEKKFIPKPDPVLLKLRPDPHPLSSEEQLLFVRITEGAFGYNEQVRNETLQLLSQDYNVKFLTPFLCQFIKEAIQVNIAFPDLSLLIYSIRMVKSLMANPNAELKSHLHMLLPAVMSCVLSKKISKYSYDNHWTLRDFSAQVVASMCHIYNNRIIDLTNRVIKVYAQAIQEHKPLTSIYGGLKGLGCLGEEAIKSHVIPNISHISQRICNILERSIYLEDNIDVKQTKHLNDVILNTAGPVLLKFRNTNDGGMQYVREFGYLGYSLYNHVKHLEKMETEMNNQFNIYLFCAKP